MRRRLLVAPEVAQVLQAAHLAQLEGVVSEPDNACAICAQFVLGEAASAVVFKDDRGTLVQLAHPECLSSGIYERPGLDAVMDSRMTSGEGIDTNTALGSRPTSPQRLVFVEMRMLWSAPEADPIEDFANRLGLVPVAGPIERIDPPVSSLSHIEPHEKGLGISHPQGVDYIATELEELTGWLALEASQTAILLTGRNLGLLQRPTLIEEALMERPCWAGTLSLRGFS